MPPTCFRYFTPAAFRFLRQLARHNERAWFKAHQQTYIDTIRTPMLQLIGDLAEPLHKLSPHFVADPRVQGSSMFRIYRDLRFSHDKRPYKEWAAFKLFHERTRELHGSAPFFYFHLEPGQCFVAAGVWHPEREALQRIRNYLLDNPASWKRITRSAAFKRDFTLGGDSLKRPPRGFDPQHELIEDLKRKDIVARCPLDEDDVLGPNLPRLLMRRYRKLAPFNDWLSGALDLDF